MLFSKSRFGDPARFSRQQVDNLCNKSALTNAVGQSFVEIVGCPDIHLADLVLGVAQLLRQCFVRLADLLQHLLRLAQLFLQRSGT
jgi:hypothetical protein